MTMERYLTHSSDDTRECKPSSISTDMNPSGEFECNICLDTVQDPVVTICGHLYCWPCIYKWIHQPSISLETPSDHQPQCPVCKAEVSETALIPLYGRGQSVTESEEDATSLGSIVPHRPKGPPYMLSTSATMNQRDARQHSGHLADYYYDNYGYTSAPAVSLSGSMTCHPMISMFGEMISTQFFGNSQSLYPYPNNSYGVAAMASARARRNVMQADQSLSRLSSFLCCCLVLCLVFF